MDNIIKKISFIIFFLQFIINPVYATDTIYPNPNFITDYYLNAGQTYPKETADLSYKMMEIVSQTGMYSSYERSIIYIEIETVEGLPPGLHYDQLLDKRRPARNTFYIFGTIPTDVPTGIYQVTLKGRDGAHPNNLVPRTLYLHIGSTTPQLKQTNLQVRGNIGDVPNTQNMSHYFQLPFGAAPIDQYKINNLDTLPSGIHFTSAGDFQGNYNQAGIFDHVEVTAHNQSGWSAPLAVTFIVSQPDSPPYPTQSTLQFNALVGETINATNLATYFKIADTASAIDSYQVLNPSALPPGIIFTPNGQLLGSYSLAGSYNNISVEAHNGAGWSTPLLLNFKVSLPNSPPFPTQTHVDVSDQVGHVINTQNMSHYFKTNSGSTAIDAYQVSEASQLPPGIVFNPTGDFHGTYTTAGLFSAIQVRAHNSNGWSEALLMNFNITEKPKVIAALNCPTLEQIKTAPLTVTVIDSLGDMHQFNRVAFSGYLWAFKVAELRKNPAYLNGLDCVYSNSSLPGPSIMYVLDPVPEGTYFGNDINNLSDLCALGINQCEFHIPQ